MTKTYKILTVTSLIFASTAMSLGVAPGAQASQPTASISTANKAASPATDIWVKQTLAAINVYRAKAKLPALRLNSSMSNISQEWADHLSIAMASPSFNWNNIHRADAGRGKLPAGFSWYGEVISLNFTAQSAVDWWMNSPGHRDALMNPKATDIGIGDTVPAKGEYAGWHHTVANLAQYPSITTPVAPKPETNPIATKAASMKGALGKALYNEVTGLRNGGKLQNFERGTVYWSKTSGAAVVTGGILSAWGAKGYENGALGYPITDEIGGLPGKGVYQEFQGGQIYWSSATGARIMQGGVKSKWLATGGVNGTLGYPTSDEIKIKNGGVYQTFQRGVIYWSSQTGAHISGGGIRSTYKVLGYENGRLGYPTSDEYATNSGMKQDYQGGSITWIRSTGSTKVVYK